MKRGPSECLVLQRAELRYLKVMKDPMRALKALDMKRPFYFPGF